MKPSDAVVHLRMRFDSTHLATGSGVLYRKGDATFIVTAWHNVTGRHSASLKILGDHGGIPNNLVAMIGLRIKQHPAGGNAFFRAAFTIPLEDQMATYYLVHPQSWPRVDVVAIPIDLDREYECEFYDIQGQRIGLRTMRMRARNDTVGSLATDVVAIQDIETATEWIPENLRDTLAAGDDLFILGYPKAITDWSGQPIWKRATVATDPDIRWQQQDKFLVDCASREGMSGAPVVSYRSDGATTVGPTTYRSNGPATVFHGVYVSRIEADSEFEAQIGTVWRAVVVDEIVDGGKLAVRSADVLVTEGEIDAAIRASWPKPNAATYGAALLGGGNLVDHFLHTYVMPALDGRADPAFVRARVLDIARERTPSVD